MSIPTASGHNAIMIGQKCRAKASAFAIRNPRHSIATHPTIYRSLHLSHSTAAGPHGRLCGKLGFWVSDRLRGACRSVTSLINTCPLIG
jgi:hypothetical protein